MGGCLHRDIAEIDPEAVESLAEPSRRFPIVLTLCRNTFPMEAKEFLEVEVEEREGGREGVLRAETAFCAVP